MSWNCPKCKQNNSGEIKKCVCGYAFYEVLGIKEDASAESVEQTYRYLIKVWKSSGDQHDNRSASRSDERLRKIEEAFSVFKQISGGNSTSSSGSNVLKIAVIAGLAVIIIAASFIIFRPAIRTPAQDTAKPGVEATSESKTAPAQPALSTQPVPNQTAAPASTERPSDRPDLSADRTPEWAIESVKKSHVLDHLFTVDVLVNKWSKENSDKLKAIGWIARKVDDKFYLVSYTATDGVTPKGFYFELNNETGEIKNIAVNPDLQQKYGIRGN